MKVSRWVCLIVLIAGTVACAVTSEDPSEDPEAQASIDLASAEDVALHMAAATGDPQIMADTASAFAAACHGNVTCSGFGSCANWSAHTACGNPYCGTYICFVPPSCPPTGPCLAKLRTKQVFEQYRVCSNPQGATCTEWRGTGERDIGCGTNGCTIDFFSLATPDVPLLPATTM